MDTNTLHITLEIVLVLLVFYLAFFKKYFREKGKKVATNEDIEEITGIIEQLKNQIHFNGRTRPSLKTEEINALVDSAEKYHYWLSLVLDAGYVGIDEDSIELFAKIENEFENARFNYILAVGRLELYVDDEELLGLHHQLNLETIQLQNEAMSFANKNKRIILELKLNKLQTPRSEEIEEEFLRLLEKDRDIHNKYNEGRAARYEVILPIHKKMQKEVYSRLTGLLGED